MSIYIMFAVMLIINAPATTGPRCCDQHSEGQLEDISKQGPELNSCDRYWNIMILYKTDFIIHYNCVQLQVTDSLTEY